MGCEIDAQALCLGSNGVTDEIIETVADVFMRKEIDRAQFELDNAPKTKGRGAKGASAIPPKCARRGTTYCSVVEMSTEAKLALAVCSLCSSCMAASAASTMQHAHQLCLDSLL
eukprot:6185154-Pleurochrysis_carterae.AAC.2